MEDKKISVIVINEADNVGIALSRDIQKGEEASTGKYTVKALDPIPMGHKIALTDIPKDAWIVKFGDNIGKATCGIKKGAHVHVHNVLDITEEASDKSRGR